MAVEITEMTIADHEVTFALWTGTEGIALSSADSREAIEVFLLRNPGLSLVARHDGQLIGAVLCGHDGRRGYLHHLAVARPHRGQGIGSRLVETCLAKLAGLGIQKCHIFVHTDNADGELFWRKVGWKERTHLKMMSKETSTTEERP